MFMVAEKNIFPVFLTMCREMKPHRKNDILRAPILPKSIAANRLLP